MDCVLEFIGMSFCAIFKQREHNIIVGRIRALEEVARLAAELDI
jgi:hypothetical protein